MLFLAILATLTGILTTLVIRRTTTPGALRDTRSRMQAHLLEFRLFFDEPSLIWEAQVSLLRDNARLLRLLLPSALILALPMTWLVLQLDTVYGFRPLRTGELAIVTAQLTRPIETTDRFELQGAGGIVVETPSIRAWHDNRVNWRIRPLHKGQGVLDLTINGRVISKSVATGEPPQLLSPRRSRSLMEFVLHPEERRVPDGDLAWIEIDYPKSMGTVPWMVWFLAISTGAALISARWMKTLR
jgi:hypothetical protein